MDSVSDIVGLPHLDDSRVQVSIINAKRKRDETLEALYLFDQTQTNQLASIETSIQSMKEWVQNIEGMFTQGLTDVNFESDKWLGISSLSRIGLSIASSQAPIGSIEHVLYQKQQLQVMLQMTLNNMSPIRFGINGFVLKSFSPYAFPILGFGNLNLQSSINESVQNVSEKSDLEEIYAALAKQTDNISQSNAASTIYSSDRISYEGMRRVLGGNGSGTAGGLAQFPIAITPVLEFLGEDLITIADPDAPTGEWLLAMGNFFIKPIKVFDKASDISGGVKTAKSKVDKDTNTKVSNENLTNGTVNVTRAQQRNLETLDNIVNKHLTDKDFSGTLRDLQGNPVPKPGGGYWNHLQEMQDSYKGLVKIRKGLEGSLNNPNLDAATRKVLQDGLDKANKNIKKIEDLFEPFGGI